MFFLTISLYSFAQVQKGDRLIGGTAALRLDFNDAGSDLFSLSLNPNYAKFVSDNFAVGGAVGLTFIKLGDINSTNINLLPMVRYYFNNSNESNIFFLEAKAGLAFIDVGSASESAFQFSVGPGIAFFIADNVSIDAILAYSRIGGAFDQAGVALNFGFQVYLNSSNNN